MTLNMELISGMCCLGIGDKYERDSKWAGFLPIQAVISRTCFTPNAEKLELN